MYERYLEFFSKAFINALLRILDRHGRKTSNGARNVGERTLTCRHEVMFYIFVELHQLGFKLPMPDSLRETHIKALVSHWLASQAAASTIQNKLSHLRQFCKWIGKPGMVRRTEFYVDDTNRHLVRRSVVAKVDLSWEGKGIDPTEVIKNAEVLDKWTGLYLRIMHAFGLRLKEAIHLRPLVDMASNGKFLSVRDGTKGGRHRVIPIETEYQRQTLSLAVRMAQSKSKRIIPAHCTLEQAYQRARYRMRILGLTKKGLGITGHGLRHQYAQHCYEQEAGIPCPIRGGDPAMIDRNRDLHVRHDVMQRMGHSRADISGAYLGGPGHKRRGESTPMCPWELEASRTPNYGSTESRAVKVRYAFVLPANATTGVGSCDASSDKSQV